MSESNPVYLSFEGDGRIEIVRKALCEKLMGAIWPGQPVF
jgi:hypothetical protein